MKIGPIVLLLRTGNTYFQSWIGGAADLNTAMQYTLTRDMAFVIPTADDVIPSNQYDSFVFQDITERFAVVVALKMDTSQSDKTGIGAHDKLHDIRGELFKLLIGKDFGYKSQIYYRGGRLLSLDRSYLWYQFEFQYTAELTTDEGGFGVITSTTVDERQYPGELDDLKTIYTEYILKPSTKWDEVEEILRGEGNHLPVNTSLPDMETWIDLSQPYTGAFAGGFAMAFDIFRENT